MPIHFDITSDAIYQQGLQAGNAGGFLKGKLKGRLEGRLEGALFQHLKVLCSMAEAKIPVSVILQVSNTPEPFVKAFLASFSHEKGERLLKAFERRSCVFIGKTLRRRIMRDLKDFGIPKDEAIVYLDQVSSTIIKEVNAVKDTESPSPQEAII